MERINYAGKDKDVADALDFVKQNALGNILIAADTPTSDTLKANQLTFYGGWVYLKLPSGISYKFQLTAI